MNYAIALSNPLDLPLHTITKIAAEPVLVVAPHPDDETLGCGGAIALLRALGYTVRILVISDGTKSHPNSRKYPKDALKELRETETRAAMSVLGAENHITFLELPDGAVPEMGTINFQAAVDRCHAYLESTNPKIILAPWRFDPHPDHRATWQILKMALGNMNVRIIEYPIWDWDLNQRQLLDRDSYDSGLNAGLDERIDAWRLDISEVLALKQRAIATYRSQTTDLIDDDPTGFRLTTEMLENFNQPWEIYLGEKITAIASLPASYFDALYQADPDPWKFATSAYEAQKYAATIAALPNRYSSALEIGGSIGVLTEMLAAHCDAVLSIDISKLAQEKAIQRCKKLPQVEFELMNFPHEYPQEKFDLILVSEVGYYWCLQDLQIAKKRILDLLQPHGNLLLVHWLPVSPDYPITGDEVHDAFMECAPLYLQHLQSQRNENYRLDLFERIVPLIH